MGKRNLTPSELEELCVLFQKCGTGDLLDFIHAIQRQGKKHGMSEELVKSIMRHVPEPQEQQEKSK